LVRWCLTVFAYRDKKVVLVSFIALLRASFAETL
jgi:hypothetical protein